MIYDDVKTLAFDRARSPYGDEYITETRRGPAEMEVSLTNKKENGKRIAEFDASFRGVSDKQIEDWLRKYFDIHGVEILKIDISESEKDWKQALVSVCVDD